MKEIDFSKQILKYKEDGLLADEKAGYPPKCKPGYEVSKDKKKCVPVKKTTEAAKTKKEWDKIDKKELKRDSKKEKGEHEKDAVKDDKSKIKKLKKGKPSEKKSVEIHDLKKDEKYDKERKAGWKKKTKGAKISTKSKNDLPGRKKGCFRKDYSPFPSSSSDSRRGSRQKCFSETWSNRH